MMTTTSVITHLSKDGEKHESSTLSDESETSSKVSPDTTANDPSSAEVIDVKEVLSMDSADGNSKDQNHHDESGLSPDLNKDDLKDGLSAGEGGPSEGKSPRARQRRRIVAGGVISLSTPTKTLVSMGSLTSLSGAFKASAPNNIEASDASDGKGSPEMQGPESQVHIDAKEPIEGEDMLRNATAVDGSETILDKN